MLNNISAVKVIATQRRRHEKQKLVSKISKSKTRNTIHKNYSLCSGGNVTQLWPSRAISASASSGPQLSGA